MKVKEFDVVLLKDGREGTVLELYDDEKVMLLEVADDVGRTLDTPFIQIEEVEKVTYHS